MAGSDPRVVARPGWMLIVCLGTVYVVWGSTYLAIRVMVETVPPLLGAGARFLAVGTILAVVVLARDRAALLSVSARELFGAALVGLLILVGGIGLVTVAETEVPSALAALIIASVPLFVVLLRRFHREKVPGRTLAAVALGFVGLSLLLIPGSDASGGRAGGLVLVLMAAAFTALGAVYSNRLSMPSNIFGATVIEMVVAGCVLLGVSALGGEVSAFRASEVSRGSLVAFGYLVTVGSLAAYTAFVWLLDNAPVSTVATYAYVNPVVALLLGAVVLRETVTRSTVVAAVAIVASVFVVVRAESAEPRRGVD